MELTKKDKELIEIATEVVKSNSDLYEHLGMHVGAAVRAKSGKIYKGININTSHSICAEQVAMGQAFACGERDLEAMVSVKMNNDGSVRVVSPCGLCRYTFDKFNDSFDVILEDIETGEILKVDSLELLPYPYKRESLHKKKV
ncbi:MAG: cytidine deaminase [Clostridia bacterium]|nr:cytidine deaminase [Clostridia bacterium]